MTSRAACVNNLASTDRAGLRHGVKAARSSMQAYAAGLTFALAASPCSTPVLATLLAYVSTTQKPVEGAGLLLAYTTG